MNNLEELSCRLNLIKHLEGYPVARYIDCSNNNLEHINLSLYGNLKELECSNNSIASITGITELEILICYNNRLSNLPVLGSLKIISCNNNKIARIESYMALIQIECNNNLITSIDFSPNLKTLICCNNLLENLPNFNNLEILNCSSNQLKDLPNMTSLLSIDCSNNNLTTLPNINTWRQLQFITFHGNNIHYLPPHIARFINHLNGNNTLRVGIYDDSQNVHDSNIQSSIRKSIDLIIRDQPEISVENVLEEVQTSDKLSDLTKHNISIFCSYTDQNINGIGYLDILTNIWCLIRKHQNKDDILPIFNEEIEGSSGLCFVGRISHLINSLNGFDPRINIEMNINHQIANIIETIRNRLTNNNTYTVEEHRKLVTDELKERNIEDSVIEIWVEAIE
jgi:hypothetical protein